MAEHVVKGADARTGERGERLLARGERVALREWAHEPAGETAPEHENAYEYAGVVLEGGLRVSIRGAEPQELRPGDSWCIPARTQYSFEVLETARVIEAVSPPDAL